MLRLNEFHYRLYNKMPCHNDMEHQLIVVIMIIFSSSFSVFAGNNVDF